MELVGSDRVGTVWPQNDQYEVLLLAGSGEKGSLAGSGGSIQQHSHGIPPMPSSSSSAARLLCTELHPTHPLLVAAYDDARVEVSSPPPKKKLKNKHPHRAHR